MSETPQLDVDIVVPVKNEEHDLEPSVTRLVEHLRCAFPFSARVTIADNGSTDGTWPVACALEAQVPRGTRRPPRHPRPRPGAARDLVVVGRRGARVHGRGPVHGPERPPPAGRAAAVRAQRRRHRNPAGPGIAGGPRSQARDHLAQLQPAAADDAGGRVLRRAVRVQGDPGRPGQAAAAAGRGQGLVLRHRTAGAGRTGRAAHPRGAGGLDRRRRLAGQHRRHRAGRPARDDSGSASVSPGARSRCPGCARPASGRRAGSRGRCRRFAVIGVALHAGLHRGLPGAARVHGRRRPPTR